MIIIQLLKSVRRWVRNVFGGIYIRTLFTVRVISSVLHALINNFFVICPSHQELREPSLGVGIKLNAYSRASAWGDLRVLRKEWNKGVFDFKMVGGGTGHSLGLTDSAKYSRPTERAVSSCAFYLVIRITTQQVNPRTNKASQPQIRKKSKSLFFYKKCRKAANWQNRSLNTDPYRVERVKRYQNLNYLWSVTNTVHCDE